MPESEPWCIKSATYRNGQTGRSGTYWWIVGPQGHALSLDSGRGPEAEENARRLRAMLHYCQGIPTEDLEKHGALAHRYREKEKLVVLIQATKAALDELRGERLEGAWERTVANLERAIWEASR